MSPVGTPQGALLPGLTASAGWALVPPMATTTSRLLELCAKRFHKEVSELQPDSDVFDSLGIDSMGALSLLSELEQQFEVEIPDYELRDVRSFAQLAECIDRRL